MNVNINDTVADVVVQNIKAAHIFKKYGIDFCCGGGITIEKACSKKDLDYKVLIKEIESIDSDIAVDHDYDHWELDYLIDYIISKHHSYVLENIPLILQYSNRVAQVHGDNYKEVIEINTLFQTIAAELNAHMKKEEVILFPFIMQLVHAKKLGLKVPIPHFGTVNNPIAMMESEHESAGDIFKSIATLTNNYTPPQGACNTFKALYAKLEEFEKDLHQHIHLENNILFPKAIKLENS